MDDHYYYLLDGKEHGPFTRAAIDSLLKSSRLQGALLRGNANQPWQSPEELGFGAPRAEAAVSASLSNPVALKFRTSRAGRSKKPSGAIYWVLALMALGAVVLFFATPQGEAIRRPSKHRKTTADTLSRISQLVAPKQEPVSVSLKPYVSQLLDQVMAAVHIQSVSGNVEIRDVRLNRGNCKALNLVKTQKEKNEMEESSFMLRGMEEPAPEKLPILLKFGDDLVVDAGACKVIEIQVDTDSGSWVFRPKK